MSSRGVVCCQLLKPVRYKSCSLLHTAFVSMMECCMSSTNEGVLIHDMSEPGWKVAAFKKNTMPCINQTHLPCCMPTIWFPAVTSLELVPVPVYLSAMHSPWVRENALFQGSLCKFLLLLCINTCPNTYELLWVSTHESNEYYCIWGIYSKAI